MCEEKITVVPEAWRLRINCAHGVATVGRDPTSARRDEQLRIVEQGLGDADALQRALRQRAQCRAALVAELHLLDDRTDALAQRTAVQSVELAVHGQHLFHGEIVVEVRLLGQKADRRARRGAERLAAKQHGAAVGVQ
jgi:hypothetical protein